MDIKKLTGYAAAATGVSRWMIVMFTLSQIALVVTLILFLTRGDTHRETLVPPVIHKSFWVENERVSKDYLVEMGVFLTQIYFDVSPANVEFNHKVLKNYVDPRFYGKLEIEAGNYAMRIKNDNASTFFSISSVIPDEKHNRIAVIGLLNTFLGDSRTSSIPKVYIFEFSFLGGKILMTGMKESNNANKPFDTKS